MTHWLSTVPQTAVSVFTGHADLKNFAKVENQVSKLIVEVFAPLKQLHWEMHERPSFFRRLWLRVRLVR